ncbi:Heat shock 70 kDa protein 4L [Trichinella pseudospiralis]|uniref:Heat shock 70 kDa protein 4L n=1 Tax=Trichinella pseudospiralis TaxID=6337 RepID=A0A0V1E6B3_TRIPS|nr:Heat shock 70 kDa protein 4L [Trichinella pseudospiralis]KRY69307.1 Heat shock 70 kDa protein 4L [Trichinella pseudospiralis]
MSVVGFDFGNQNCYVGVARQGGIEIITNDYSLRATPSCVAYGGNMRSMGTAAKQKLLTNLQNTVFGFKNLIGRKCIDPVVTREVNKLPYRVVHGKAGDKIGIEASFLFVFKVNHAGNIYQLFPEEVLAALLHKLRLISEDFLQAKVSDCVISVPCFWTDVQRRAVLDASKIADLNCLKLMNETTAVALAYGIYKQETFPADNENPLCVVFIDMGYSSTQVCACAFNKGKLKMLGTVWDCELGGRDFDQLLYMHFASEFQKKFNLDISTVKKASLRLMDECEKLKKQMAADPNKIPISIECIMNDMDFSSSMKREEFDLLADGLWKRLETLLIEIQKQSNLSPDQIHSVELVGGSSRLPMVRTLVKKCFAKDPSTSLNQDEAVARGCTLQCAILSPTFRVREFGMTDIQPHAVNLHWSTANGEEEGAEVFCVGHPFPFSKVLSFFRNEPFYLKASYADLKRLPIPDPLIGTFFIQNVRALSDGTPPKIKVKIRISPSGLFSVCSANMVEKIPAGEKQQQSPAMDEDDQQPEKEENSPTSEATVPEAKTGDDNQVEDGDQAALEKNKKTAKAKSKITELVVISETKGMTAEEIQECRKHEINFEELDRGEREREDAKNSLEEYVYDMRDKLSGILQPYIIGQDASRLRKLLEDTEVWLYEDGEEQPKGVYQQKLTEMKDLSDPVVERYNEAGQRPHAFEELEHNLQMARKMYEAYLSKEEQFSHWEEKEADNLIKAIEATQKWLDDNINAQNRRALTDPPVVFVSQIIAEKERFDSLISPIVNKPKPKKDNPPPPESQKSTTTNKNDPNLPNQNTPPEEMDVE